MPAKSNKQKFQQINPGGYGGMTLSKARALLPPEERGMNDQELSALLSQLYEYADLVIDIYEERRANG